MKKSYTWTYHKAAFPPVLLQGILLGYSTTLRNNSQNMDLKNSMKNATENKANSLFFVVSTITEMKLDILKKNIVSLS